MKHTYIEERDIGQHVICDACGEDYTNRTDKGGFLFGSNAYCPACARRQERVIIGYGEEWNIRARCPKGQEFRAWVLALRNGNNTIRVITSRNEP